MNCFKPKTKYEIRQNLEEIGKKEGWIFKNQILSKNLHYANSNRMFKLIDILLELDAPVFDKANYSQGALWYSFNSNFPSDIIFKFLEKCPKDFFLKKPYDLISHIIQKNDKDFFDDFFKKFTINIDDIRYFLENFEKILFNTIKESDSSISDEEIKEEMIIIKNRFNNDIFFKFKKMVKDYDEKLKANNESS